MNEESPEFIAQRKKLLSQPINQIKVNGDMTVSDLVENFSDMSIQARNMGKAAKIWEKMLMDERSYLVDSFISVSIFGNILFAIEF